MLQPMKLSIVDRDKLFNSFNDYFISLNSSYVIVRHHDHVVMDPYSPNKFGFHI